MEFTERMLAITDVETTGLDANIHEILEIGLLVVDQKTLKLLDKYEVKVRPVNLRSANRKALQVAGYNERDWRKSVDLEVAMQTYSDKTRDAVFFAHNVYFDWSFITRAFQKTGVEDHMDYHRVDLFTIAWARRKELGLKKLNLDELAKRFGIPPEPQPHRALNGVKLELAVLKKLTTP